MKSREAYLQSECLKWFRYQYSRMASALIHIPNGGSRSKIEVKQKDGTIKKICREGKELKAMGATAGVSDLLLLIPRNGFGCLCIEMKTETGKQSIEQILWQSSIEKAGNKYVVCRNFDQFRTEVNNYLLKNYDTDNTR